MGPVQTDPTDISKRGLEGIRTQQIKLSWPGSRPPSAAARRRTGRIACPFAPHDLRAGRRRAERFFNDWVYNVVFVGAAFACLARGFLVRAERGAWLAIGAGLFSWGLGDIYWTLFLADLETIPYPSPADVFYICHYFGLFVGIVCSCAARDPALLRASGWTERSVRSQLRQSARRSSIRRLRAPLPVARPPSQPTWHTRSETCS